MTREQLILIYLYVGNMDDTFIKPDGHEKFMAKKLFNKMGKIQWGAVAYIEENGGGPKGNHTYSDNHLFIVVEGEVKIFLGETAYVVKTDEIFFVNGMTPHSIWNKCDVKGALNAGLFPVWYIGAMDLPYI